MGSLRTRRRRARCSAMSLAFTHVAQATGRASLLLHSRPLHATLGHQSRPYVSPFLLRTHAYHAPSLWSLQRSVGGPGLRQVVFASLRLRTPTNPPYQPPLSPVVHRYRTVLFTFHLQPHAFGLPASIGRCGSVLFGWGGGGEGGLVRTLCTFSQPGLP